MQIEGILFDKDGTLFDFQASWGAWTFGFIQRLAGQEPARQQHLAAALGFDLEAQAFHPESAIIASSADYMITCIAEALPELPRETIQAEVIYGTAAAPQVPVASLPELLSRLQGQGLPLGVATNDAELPARRHLEAAGVDHLFDFVAGYDSGFGAKPAPGMLLGFCEATGIEPARVAMVGDSTHDLHAAHAAGMVRVGVLTGVADRADLTPHADTVLASIADLPEWLASRNATHPLSQTTMI